MVMCLISFFFRGWVGVLNFIKKYNQPKNVKGSHILLSAFYPVLLFVILPACCWEEFKLIHYSLSLDSFYIT